MAIIKKIKSIYFNDSRNISKYDISIEDSLGNEFIMFFGGNLDLYWVPKKHKTRYIINKQDAKLYKIFDTLYISLKEIAKSEESKSFCDANELFDSNQFFWYSEDAPIEDAAKLTITPEGDTYVINFEMSKSIYTPQTTSIRFTNSGSRNHLVVNLFMDLRNYLLRNIPDPLTNKIEDINSI